MLISIETHITCDFQGGSGPPITHSGSAHGDPDLLRLIWASLFACLCHKRVAWFIRDKNQIFLIFAFFAFCPDEFK